LDEQQFDRLENATGEMTLLFSIKSHEELYGNQLKNADAYICINGTEIVIPLNDGFDSENFETVLNAWLTKPSMVTRGVAYTVRDVIVKLKRFDFVPLPQKGTSHLHYLHPDGTGKVTVPVHSGEIPKGTFKSILNQMGIDLRTFQMA
jgi:predicted RNA binding protein YcfA (HicA-like mRNA interferase family)